MAALMARIGGGTPEPVRALSTLTDELWDRMIKVHLYGTFHGTRAALRHMEPARSGAIVNIASIYGLRGSPATPDYAAAKHGIVGLTRSVGHRGRRRSASGSTPSPPGFIDTPLLAPVQERDGDPACSRSRPAGSGRPEEVAELVRFLAGPESSYCFGEVLTLTGGF